MGKVNAMYMDEKEKAAEKVEELFNQYMMAKVHHTKAQKKYFAALKKYYEKFEEFGED